MRVERIKDGVLATERGVCFKSPCPEKLLLFSGRRRVGLSPEDCRKRMYLAQAWAPLFARRQRSQRPSQKRAQARCSTKGLACCCNNELMLCY